jgi:NTP pyrophosphatase (non-canonical NTP hydrolase)
MKHPFPDNFEQICQDAIKVFGGEIQLNQLQEECGELVAAVNHYRRGRPVETLIEELGDVLIIAYQVRLLLGTDIVDQSIQAKLTRLEEKMDELRKLSARPAHGND